MNGLLRPRLSTPNRIKITAQPPVAHQWATTTKADIKLYYLTENNEYI